MKKCNVCKVEKALNDFHKKASGKFGVRSHCKSCTVIMSSRYYQDNKEQVDLTNKSWYLRNKDVALGISKRSRDKRIASGKSAATLAARRSRKLKATPEWLTSEQHDDMKAMYTLAKKWGELFSVDYHVDHIVPLNGENICGLHVPWNLQLLEAKLNISKSNSYSNQRTKTQWLPSTK